VLVQHVWSLAGDVDRADVNATFLLPFLTCTPSQRRRALLGRQPGSGAEAGTPDHGHAAFFRDNQPHALAVPT
jgi:hypothetical protein